MCLIIIPAFPNTTCPAFNAPGSFGGTNYGGGNCPVCQQMCATGYTFDTGTQCCTPEPRAPYCSNGAKCTPGAYDTGMGTCRCPTGSFWDTGLQLCCPTTPT